MNIKIKLFTLYSILLVVLVGCRDKVDNDILSAVDSDENNSIKEQEVNIGGYSNIHHMLKPHIAGYYTTYSKLGAVEHIVVLKEIITGKRAMQIIKDYCDSPDSPHGYEEPSKNCSWHIAVFTVSDDPKLFYTDCKIRGLDGENLEFNGYAYSSRGYDILNQYYQDDVGYHNLMVYYAVPDGCKEYVLEFGDRNPQKDMETTAFYHIKNEDISP